MKILNVAAFKEAIKKAIDDNVSLVVNFATIKVIPGDETIDSLRWVPYNYDGDLSGQMYKKYIDGGLFKFDHTYGTFPLEIAVPNLIKILKDLGTKNYVSGVLVAVYNGLSVANRGIIDANIESVKELEHSAFYNVTYDTNKKQVSVENIYGEHIVTLDLYKSFEVHVDAVGYEDLDNLIKAGYAKVFGSYDSGSEERVIAAIRKELEDTVTVIHLSHYDAWCIVENKLLEQLKKTNRSLNIEVPDTEVMHVIGRGGSNLAAIINKYGLPKISVRGVVIDNAIN